MKNINQKEWEELTVNDHKAMIIDVRTPKECTEGVIEGAVMIDFLNKPILKLGIEKLDKSKNYYVYCRSGNRSGQVCQLLEGLGFEEVFNLTGGMLVWNGKTVLPQ